MDRARRVIFKLLISAVVLVPVRAAANDYPTVARADYVFACMAGNGQSRRVLEQCSCSIDVIADQIPYDDFVEAETILRMSQVPGAKGSFFQAIPHLKERVTELRRAQAEAEIRCF